ncbi:MAG: imelysin family protein [Ferrimonas sp.]
MAAMNVSHCIDKRATDNAGLMAPLKSTVCRLLGGLLWLGLIGCGEQLSSDAGPDFASESGNLVASTFNQQALISNLADNVIAPVFQQSWQQTQQLNAEVTQYCDLLEDAIEGNVAPSEPVLTRLVQAQQQAQNQWRTTMDWWQQAELMQVGPLASGGALRNRIYSWPVVNRCAVDQEVVLFEAGEINGSAYDISQRTDPRKGLDALEYLLFTADLNHQCSAELAPAGWQERSDLNKQYARCALAQAIGQELALNLQQLTSAWDEYTTELKQAGLPDNPFSDAQQAINALSDGLFYLDGYTKDAKLMAPYLAYADQCDLACINALESGLSGHSLANVGQNYQAVRALFEGLGGVGFDDYLVAVGHPELAQQMLANIDQAIAQQQQLGNSLGVVLNSDADQIATLQQQTKAITDQLKVDFITSLALELPATSAGDND